MTSDNIIGIKTQKFEINILKLCLCDSQYIYPVTETFFYNIALKIQIGNSLF